MSGFSRYSGKRLCDVVFPGAHDAGIYGDALGNSAKTQKLDILEQAIAGVRWFDLRIANLRIHGVNVNKAYHAPSLHQRGDGTQKMVLHERVHVGMGDAGEDTLRSMLQQARNFVNANPSEFLILRFSKCGDMPSVVDICHNVLAGVLLADNVCLNTALISDLAGHVIVLIDDPEWALLPTETRIRVTGIMSTKSLFSKDDDDNAMCMPYVPFKYGLQYFGKFSNKRKHKNNLKKQNKTLAVGPASSPELLGMVYWTLTTQVGLSAIWDKNIKKRNKNMWAKHEHALVGAWENGVKSHILARAGHVRNQWDTNGYPATAVGQSAAAFMPNIIMIDFADATRCSTIWSLNGMLSSMQHKMGNDLAGVGNLD